MQIEDGRYAGNALSWHMKMQKPISVKLSVALEVTGDTLQGAAKAGFFGKAKITGSRVSQVTA